MDVFREKIAATGCEMLVEAIGNETKEPTHVLIKPELKLKKTTLTAE